MDFISKKWGDFCNRLMGQRESVEPRNMTKSEQYFDYVYKIICWEDPKLTFTAFLFSNFLFWIVILLQLRLFGIISILTLIFFVIDNYLEINHEPHSVLEKPHLELLNNIIDYWNDVYLSLKLLRKDSPSLFCGSMSLLFLVFTFAARNVSGYLMFYLFLLGLFFIPLGLINLPPKYLDGLKFFLQTLHTNVVAEEELIPFIESKDLDKRDISFDSLLSENTGESVSSSLIGDLNIMPSHLDAEDKESLEEEDLMPSTSARAMFSTQDSSSDSDSEKKGIRFDSSHFNGDSSSEEEAYAKNLQFPTVDRNSAEREVDNSGIMGALTSNLAKLANLVKKQDVPDNRKHSSSSSDGEFEIINSEEINEQ